MRLKTPKILLFYKKSVFDMYFLHNKAVFNIEKSRFLKEKYKQICQAHTDHYQTIQKLESLLKEQSISYDKRTRGQKVPFHKYDCIITLGGDGTFLDAARFVRNEQLMIGIRLIGNCMYHLQKIHLAGATQH